jgi:GNAT superfamily N-acetyltransferase
LGGDKTLEVEIRPLEAEELATVEEQWPRPTGTHEQRLLAQQLGIAVYLFAWWSTEAVGHLLIRWTGASQPVIRSRWPQVPYLVDVMVKEAWRRRGVGTRLLVEAEALARARGASAVGLSVGVGNEGALRLYRRLGYREVGVPPYSLTWPLVMADGGEQWIEEVCLYLQKSLVAGSGFWLSQRIEGS